MLTGKTSTIVLLADASSMQVKHQLKMLESVAENIIFLPPQLGEEYDAWLWQEGRIGSGNNDISIESIDSVMVSLSPYTLPTRNRFESAPYGLLDWQNWYSEYRLQRDRYDTLMGWLFYLESLGKPIFNPQSKSLLSSKKPFQLTVLKKVGCLLPDTLITNDLLAANHFITQYPDAILKPASGGELTISAEDMSTDQWSSFKRNPVILQERIYGSDLRVILVEHKVVSVAAVKVPEGTLDFRGEEEYYSGSITYDEITLPEEVKLSCARVTRALGLRFAGIDIKLTENNQHYFLECNSSPIYLDVERKLQHPITEHLVQALLSA